MYNRIIVAGNLTRDIEMRYTQGGSAIANTAIASTRKFKSQTGEQKEEVLFVDITFFGKTAELANQYLHKGSKVLIEGRLKLDQWTDQQGQKKSKHTVTVETMQFLDSKPQDGQQQQGYQQPQQQGYQQPQQQAPQATPQNNIDDPNRHNVGGNMNRPPNGQQVPVQQPQQQQGYQDPVQQQPTQNQHGAIPTMDVNEQGIPF